MILIWLHRLQGVLTEMIGGRTALGVDGCFLTQKLQFVGKDGNWCSYLSHI